MVLLPEFGQHGLDHVDRQQGQGDFKRLLTPRQIEFSGQLISLANDPPPPAEKSGRGFLLMRLAKYMVLLLSLGLNIFLIYKWRTTAQRKS